MHTAFPLPNIDISPITMTARAREWGGGRLSPGSDTNPQKDRGEGYPQITLSTLGENKGSERNTSV